MAGRPLVANWPLKSLPGYNILGKAGIGAEDSGRKVGQHSQLVNISIMTPENGRNTADMI